MVAGLTLGSGCQETPGELDPEVVHDLSRRPGDAEGLDLTGAYAGQITLLECGCPELDGLEGLSICHGMGGLKPEAGDSGFLMFEVVQTDGILMMRVEDLSLTGPVDDDGAFAVGGVFDMTTIATTGKIVTRVDGNFDPDSNRNRLEADAAVRITGEAAVAHGALDDRTSIDCVERYEIEGSQ